MKDDLQGYEPEPETASSHEKGTVKYEGSSVSSWKPKKLYSLTDLTLGKFQIGRDGMSDSRIIMLWAAEEARKVICAISA